MREEDGAEFVETVLEWYVENGRHDLPWRDLNVSPFEVLVAELMLQQTSAEQVRGVYDEFVEQYRTVGALLAAPEADVSEAIEPLDLRKRTVYFRRAAAQLLARHDGRVPDSRSELLDLHGVDEYTAASVLAHAYGRDASAVDTNVARVLSRVFGLGLAEEPEAFETWELADRLAPSGRCDAPVWTHKDSRILDIGLYRLVHPPGLNGGLDLFHAALVPFRFDPRFDQPFGFGFLPPHDLGVSMSR